jgi:diguanylate cyclase (GGDEF)-like protein
MAEEASAVIAQALQARIKARENRGLVILIFKLLLYAVLFAGLMELFYPGAVTKYIDFHPTLPQLSLGLFGMVVGIFLFDLLQVGNWQRIRRARVDLITELSRRDMAERLSLIDPVTGTFDRRYLDEIIPRETARADRRDTSLTFVKLALEKFDGVDERLGFQASERILKEAVQLMKRCFRPTDIIVRYGVADFLIILPETAKHGALTAVRRLLGKAEDWNRREAARGFEMHLSVGVADYAKGKDVRDALADVETRVQLYRDTQAPGG